MESIIVKLIELEVLNHDIFIVSCFVYLSDSESYFDISTGFISTYIDDRVFIAVEISTVALMVYEIAFFIFFG